MLGLHTHFDSTDEEVWGVQTTQKSTKTLPEDMMSFLSENDSPPFCLCTATNAHTHSASLEPSDQKRHQADTHATSVQLRSTSSPLRAQTSHAIFIFLRKCEQKLLFTLQDVARVRREMKRGFCPGSAETSGTWILCWRQIRLASDLSAKGTHTHTHSSHHLQEVSFSASLYVAHYSSNRCD